MKIFSPITPFFETPSGLDGGIAATTPISPGEDWLLWPDSCWILSNRPVFIPDFDEYFIGVPALAGKIGRLGKTVADRFAHRYISELTAAVIVLPKKAEKTLESGRIPLGSDLCFDNAVIIGDWVKTGDSLDADTELDIRLEEFFIPDIDPVQRTEPWYDFRMKAAPGCLFPTIVEASRRHTLKMGDVILFPLADFAFDLRENENIRISIPALSSGPLLTTRFK